MPFFSSVLNAEPKTSAAAEVLVIFPSRLPAANPRAQPLGQSLWQFGLQCQSYKVSDVNHSKLLSDRAGCCKAEIKILADLPA